MITRTKVFNTDLDELKVHDSFNKSLYSHMNWEIRRNVKFGIWDVRLINNSIVYAIYMDAKIKIINYYESRR